MLKKAKRLTKDEEFDYVFKKGRSNYDKIIGIKAALNNLTCNRYGIMVSNKISKKAVERNKIKRQIKVILNILEENIKIGYDIIIIALPEIKEKKYSEIEISIKNNLKKLKLDINV